MFIYPENLKAKPMLWLWLLRDIAVIGIGALLSVLALTQGLGMGLLVVTVLYAFLTIQVDGSAVDTSALLIGGNYYVSAEGLSALLGISAVETDGVLTISTK